MYGLGNSFDDMAYAIGNDSTASAASLAQAFIECFFPNGTCNVTELVIILDGEYKNLKCYLSLADGSHQLTDGQAALIIKLSYLNDTAVEVSIAGDCDTL